MLQLPKQELKRYFDATCQITAQTPEVIEKIIGTSVRTSVDVKSRKDPLSNEQISFQTPEVMQGDIAKLIEDKDRKEISTAEKFTETPREKWREDSPIKQQIRTQNPVVGEEYRPSDETNLEDPSDRVPISTPTSEGEVKIIGTSAEFQSEGSYHKEISTQTSEVEKGIIGTPVEDKSLEDSFIAIQICTQTVEVVGEIIRTPAEEMEQFSTQASEGVEENRKTGEEKEENSSSKAPKISERLKDLQEKLSVVEENLKIPELKGKAFHVTKKLDLISRHNTTIQELYTQVMGMMREACKCDEFLREKFYDFSHCSLRAVHNNLNNSFADLQSEQGNMTAAEKRKLDSLILSRKGREKQIMYLDKILNRLFSSVSKHHQCHLAVYVTGSLEHFVFPVMKLFFYQLKKELFRG